MKSKTRPQTSLFDEMIVDNFAGGGGASVGIELATGRPVDIAINHDPAAVLMHRANHPYTRHYREDVWKINPVEVCGSQKVALAWFSPDCKHFSKAKGGKPRSKKIRGLAWVAVKWAATVHPRVIMLENVEEFQTWGPLDQEGQPIKKESGRTFHCFVNALGYLGYKVEFRELRACDYGAPTIRKRFFLIARSDDRPIVWPEPTHGDPESEVVKSGELKPWRTAAEIIDWSIPCPSIFERKKPLAENTMRRIARGIQKFVIDNPEPFIVPIGYGERKGQAPRVNSIEQPLSTIVSSCKQYLVVPSLIQYHSETAKNEVRGQSVTEPIMTVDSSPRYALVSAFISKFYKTGIGQSMNEPLHTVTTSPGHFAEVQAFLIKYYGGDIGQDLKSPLHTVTSRDRFGLVTIHDVDYQIVDIGLRMLTPRELFAAQGFPPDYIIDVDCEGHAYPKSEQVARCGNAVPPPFAVALVRANLPEPCVRHCHSMAELRDTMAV